MVKKILIEIPEGEYEKFIDQLNSGPFNLEFSDYNQAEYICPSFVGISDQVLSLRTNVVNLRHDFEKGMKRLREQITRGSIPTTDLLSEDRKHLEPIVRDIVDDILYEKKQFGQ